MFTFVVYMHVLLKNFESKLVLPLENRQSPVESLQIGPVYFGLVNESESTMIKFNLQ